MRLFILRRLFVLVFSKAPALFNTVLFGVVLFSAALFGATAASAQQQTAAQELQQELESFKSLTADFEQRVINQDLKLIDLQTGKFFLQRPGLFKWQYSGGEQDIVSDGETIFFVMRDLEQVIKKDFDTAIQTVPSLILVTDSSKLSELFAIEKLAGQERVKRFQLLPKSLDSNYESVMVSFLNGKLLGLRLVDVLGQTTEVILSATKNNPEIPQAEFKAAIPADYDVIEG